MNYIDEQNNDNFKTHVENENKKILICKNTVINIF